MSPIAERAGSRLVHTLPESALALSPKLRKAYAVYEGAIAAKRSASNAITRAKNGVERAANEDTLARAAHIKSGASKPFQAVNVPAAEIVLKDAEQEYAAHEVLIEEAEVATVEEIVENRKTYLAKLAEQAAGIAESYSSAIRQLEQARLAAHELRRLLYFVRMFPDERWRPVMPSPVRGVRGLQDTQIDFGLLTQALYQDADQLFAKADNREEVSEDE